ncbi:DUF1996 domain-containing protein [Streptomyces gilvosporeus]|uniref:DUF1996 domain-containing protein n=1 Tax=Streptomyces gilvosporeus TaxID=553510 RepID=A0A1V0TRJ7_9ACTN|nr:DUF1996 domain-containing protein [Streptomyces gilvosporeus]ARF55480.1 hypothetical protein B1H19_15975 [Streptomyces gilvosporeus]
MLVAAGALLLAGGGLAAVATTALAGNSDPNAEAGHQRTTLATTISCPDVGDRLRQVPSGARLQVSKGLAALDRQVATAYEQMSGSQGNKVLSNDVLSRLKQQRSKTIGTMANAIARNAKRPTYLMAMSGCTTKPTGDRLNAAGQTGSQYGTKSTNDGWGQSPSQDPAQGGDPSQQGQSQVPGQSQDPNQGQSQGQQGGPSPDDFADINTVQPNAGDPPFAAPQGSGASTGTFTSECGRNEDGHFNSDNVIVTPGVSNGAHHTHDYVGNKSTDANSNDQSLAASDTTCTNGDLSTYYWPVLRKLDGTSENTPGAGHDGNNGSVLTPASVTIQYRGSQAGAVRAMPQDLRIITGDAKALTNGTANANASWSCTGFENRQLKDKYPLCPQGSQVVRTFAFQNCWDGRNTDSANHRTHVAFSDRNGQCPQGFTAIPQLVERLTYDVPQGDSFAVDSFPEQLHKPVTDHGDFINVMPTDLMNKAVDCINRGQKCT